jgi:nucleotide-binding universal stress UspA family protein
MEPAKPDAESVDMQPGDVFVCAVGADEQAERLVGCARQLARVTGLRPLFVHVVDPSKGGPNAIWVARSLLRHAGARTAEMRVLQGEPGAQLVGAVHRERAALALVATRGTGPLKAALLGSVSRSLLVSAPVPVMVLPPGAEPMFDEDRVLCGVDDRLEPDAIVDAAARLGHALGRPVVVARIVDDDVEAGEADGVHAVPCSAAGDELERLAGTLRADVIVIGWDPEDPLREIVAPPVALALSNSGRRVVVVVPRAARAAEALA